MKKVIQCCATFLFAALLPHAGYCQEFKIRNYQNIEFGLHFTSLFDPGYQGVGGRLGGHFNPKLMVFVGGAYGLGSESLLSFDAKKIKQKFSKALVGVRYTYREDSRKKRSSYLEFQFSFRPERFFRSNDWYYSNGQYLQYGGALVSKKSWQSGFHFGKRRQLSKKVFLDWYVGLNVSISSIQHHAFETTVIEKPLMGGIMRKFDRNEGFSTGATPKIGVIFSLRPFNQVIKIK